VKLGQICSLKNWDVIAAVCSNPRNWDKGSHQQLKQINVTVLPYAVAVLFQS